MVDKGANGVAGGGDDEEYDYDYNSEPITIRDIYTAGFFLIILMILTGFLVWCIY